MFDDYLGAVLQIESNGNWGANASTSSASGGFQFIDSTWDGMLNQHGDEVSPGWRNLSLQDRRGLRSDPRVGTEMARRFTAANQNQMVNNLGRDITPSELYMGHFMGAGGATQFLRAYQEDPTANAATMFPSAARANRAIYYRRDARGRRTIPRTIGEVYSVIDNKYARASGSSLSSPPGHPGLSNRSAATSTGMAGNSFQQHSYSGVPVPELRPTQGENPMGNPMQELLNRGPQMQAQMTPAGNPAPGQPPAQDTPPRNMEELIQRTSAPPQEAPETGALDAAGGLAATAGAAALTGINELLFGTPEWVQAGAKSLYNLTQGNDADYWGELEEARDFSADIKRTANRASVTIPGLGWKIGSGDLATAAGLIGGGIMATPKVAMKAAPAVVGSVGSRAANMARSIVTGKGITSKWGAAAFGALHGGVQSGAYTALNLRDEMFDDEWTSAVLTDFTIGGALGGALGGLLTRGAPNSFEEAAAAVQHKATKEGATVAATAPGARAAAVTAEGRNSLMAAGTRRRAAVEATAMLPTGEQVVQEAVQREVIRPMESAFTALGRSFTGATRQLPPGARASVFREEMRNVGMAVHEGLSHYVTPQKLRAFARNAGQSPKHQWGTSFLERSHNLYTRFLTSGTNGGHGDIPVDFSAVFVGAQKLSDNLGGSALAQWLKSSDVKVATRIAGQRAASGRGGTATFAEAFQIRSLLRQAGKTAGNAEADIIRQVLDDMDGTLRNALPTDAARAAFDTLDGRYHEMKRIMSDVSGILGAGRGQGTLDALMPTIKNGGKLDQLLAVKDILTRQAPEVWNDMRRGMVLNLGTGADGAFDIRQYATNYGNMAEDAKVAVFGSDAVGQQLRQEFDQLYTVVAGNLETVLKARNAASRGATAIIQASNDLAGVMDPNAANGIGIGRTMLGMVGAPYVVAHALVNPAFRRTLTRTLELGRYSAMAEVKRRRGRAEEQSLERTLKSARDENVRSLVQEALKRYRQQIKSE